MKPELISLEDLHHPEANVRVHSEYQLQEFARALTMFGQTRPAVIDENNIILAGNGMIQAMRLNNTPSAYAIRYTGLSDVEKKKLMLSDNRIYELGTSNRAVTNDFLSDLALMDDFDVPGFDEEIIKMLMATSAEVDELIADYGNEIAQRENAPGPDAPRVTAPVLETGAPKEEAQHIRCPHCGEQVWI